METPQSDPSPPSDPATASPPVLQYQVPAKIEARWGMPMSAQLIFGIIFFFVSVGIIVAALAGVGPLALVIFIMLVLIAVYIRREWKWPGFTIGILLAICASILTAGICAIVVSG